MSHPIILKILEDIANDLHGKGVEFPTLLDIAFKIRTVLKAQNPDMNQLARLVGAEPLISTQVVRLANSVAMNPSGRKIVDVKNAIVRVGIRAVSSVAFSIAMKQMAMAKGLGAFKTLSRHLWEHSAYTAAFARTLVKRYCRGKINDDEAMFTGLIHDIGAFYLLYRASLVPELAQNPAEVQGLMVEWHDSIGHALLSSMGLADPILEAVKTHEQPRTFETIENLADLLSTANQLANIIAPWHAQPLAEKGDFLDRMFDADTLQCLLGEAEIEIEALKDLIQ
ncbi:MAG: HDOD domain-containing protein [Zoogloeaceae bacterium]|nr:HDOD domain-containing protein [Zoogloeaceae bacterium]